MGNKELNYDELSKILFPKDFIGAIINLSFCAELLLKSMNVKSKKIHLLNELFNDIEENWRDIIKEKMDYNELVFNNLLEDISDYFEKWRYYYELPQDERKAEFSFLRNFTINLMSVAHSKYYYEKGDMNKISKIDLILINKYFN